MPNKSIESLAHEALQAIKKADMTLEVNVAGFRKPIAEAYPSIPLLSEAYKLGIPITFASDAHIPEQVGLFSSEAIEMAKKAGYTKCVYYQKRVKKFLDF